MWVVILLKMEIKLSSEYQFSRDYPLTPIKSLKPSKKIAIINQTEESLNRPHDLILLT